MTQAYTQWKIAPLLALLVAGMSAPACDRIEDVLDTDDEPAEATTYTGPRKRAARLENVRCFESYGKFKRAMGKQGLRSLGGTSEWHHIAGQHNENKDKFGEYDLHCTDNIILLEKTVHTEINGYYSRSREELGEKSFRNWLKPMSFDEQYVHGIKALEEVRAKWDWIK